MYGKSDVPGQSTRYDICEKLNIYYIIAKTWLHLLLAIAVEILNSEAMSCRMRYLCFKEKGQGKEKHTNSTP